MRRLPRVSWLRLIAALSLLAATSAQAQRLTELRPVASFNNGIGCVGLRCFPGIGPVDGNTAIMTAYGTGVMVRSASGVWSVQQELWNPDTPGRPTMYDPLRSAMGAPAGLSGDVLLLTGTSRVYSYVPVIYVWKRTAGTWAHTQVLALPRTSALDEMYVGSVKLSQQTAAVCTLHSDRAQIDIFTLQSNGRFLRQAQIIPPITFGDIVDCQLALEGNTLLVHDPMANQATGRVLVYQRGPAGWVLRHRLTAADGSPGAQFGGSVAISGNTIVVSAPRRPNFDQPLHLGAAYIFQRTAAGWAQVQLLVKPEFFFDDMPQETDEAIFGYEVSISGDRLSISWANFGGLSPPAYLYERRGVWAPVAGLIGEEYLFGSVGLLSGSIAVQSVGDGHSGSSGVAYELPPLWTLPPRVENP